MEDQIVTRLWMASIMIVMAITALFAWYGQLRSEKAAKE